jgi:hypothetical protein
MLKSKRGEAMEEEETFQLTRGSKYRIESLESREKPLITNGEFKGYTVIGHDDAICMEMDDSHGDLKGKYRLIPTHMVVAIDVITAAKDETDKDKEKTSLYFG